MNTLVVVVIFFGLTFLLKITAAVDSTKEKIKVLVPNIGDILSQPPFLNFHSDTVNDVDFSTRFIDESHTDLLTLKFTFVNRLPKVFIGARNYVYRISIVENEEDELSDLELDQTSFKITFRNWSSCYTVNASKVSFSLAKPDDNDIKVLFAYQNQFLFACGTDNCGRCERFSLSNLSDANFFFNTERGNVADFISGHRSAFVFEGHYNKSKAYYVAVEPDGRQPEQAPPFFSARSINNDHMRFTSKNSQSESRVDFSPQFSSTHTFRILYGFEHNGYSYLLTLQPPMGNKTLENFVQLETRLVRICTTDSLFDSYMEIPLVCKVINKQNGANSSKPIITYHRQAVAATFAENASALFRKHRSKKNENFLEEKQITLSLLNRSLYVSFRNNETSSAKFDIESENPLCHFDMDVIEATFRSVLQSCNTNGVDVQLLETVHGSKGPLKCESIEGHIPEKELVCGHVGNSNNKFILGRQTPPGKHVLSLANDVITSIGAVIYKTDDGTTRSELLLGTEKSQIMKVQLNSTLDYHKLKFISQQEKKFGLFIANPAFNPQTGNFYFLSRRSLTEVPIFRCEVYTSCGACFRAEEKCVWRKNKQCKSYKTNDQILLKRQCPLEVYGFTPNSGPVVGGTKVFFFGKNFGLNRLENENSFNVTIGNKACKLLHHKNDHFACLIEYNIQEDNSITIFNEGIITITAASLANSSEFEKLGFNVFGHVRLEDRFAFKKPTLNGVLPSFGPEVGGTFLVVKGTDLNIGSSISVHVNYKQCKVIVRASSYVICKIAPKKLSNVRYLSYFQNPIKVVIDYDVLLLGENKTRKLKTDNIFDDKKNLENYMKKWSVKLTEHNITEHPFSNISLFVHFLEKKKLLTIGQSFQYRPNSVVKGIFDRPEDKRHTKTWDVIYAVSHGGTVITFEGEHMDSALFPMLSLSFTSTNTQKKETVNSVSSVLCNVFSKTVITCHLPPAPNSLLPIVYRYPLKARYVLHLDGQQIDSNKLPVNNETQVQLKKSEILYYPEPEFTPFTADPVLVSIQTLHVTLEGKYLKRELFYKIQVHSNEYLTSSTDGIKCIIFETADETVANFIKCKLVVGQKQVESLIDKKLRLSITIGNKTKNIGMIKLSNKNVFLMTNSLLIVCGLLIVSTFCVVAQAFIYFKTKRANLENISNTLYGTELSSLPTLKNFFTQAYNNLDLYNQLDAIGKIICPNKVKNSDFSLGTGNFGIVTRGKYQNEDIAIKTLKEISTAITFNREISQISNQSNQTAILCQGEVLKDFFKEALIMKDFDHPNVLSLIGVTLVENYPSLLLPFMTYGDLHTYVKNQMSTPDVQHLIEYAIQVARGMTYLSERNFVHRDLAARNCLIGQNRQTGQAIIKVADFGLSQDFGDRSTYYRINCERKLPYRWMPPESLNGSSSVATLKSDIWSYGVLVWELTTRGQLPYEKLGAEEVMALLRSGRRLSKPQYCPDLIYSIMSLCWLDDPAERPEFKNVLLLMEEAFAMMMHQKEAPNAEVNIPHNYVNLADAVPSPADFSFNFNNNPDNNTDSPAFNFCDTNIRLSLTQYYEKSRSLVQLLTSQHPNVFRQGSGDRLEMVKEGELPEERSSSRSASPFPPPYSPPPYSAEDDTASVAGSVVLPTSQPNVVPNVAPHTHLDSNFGNQETLFLPTNAVTTTTH